MTSPPDMSEAFTIAQDLVGFDHDGVSIATQVLALRSCDNALRMDGDREHEAAIWSEIERLQQRTPDSTIPAELAGHRITIAFFEGRLDDVISECQRLRAEHSLGEDSIPQSRIISAVLGFRAPMYLGDYEEALKGVADRDSITSIKCSFMRTLVGGKKLPDFSMTG